MVFSQWRWRHWCGHSWNGWAQVEWTTERKNNEEQRKEAARMPTRPQLPLTTPAGADGGEKR